MLARRPGLVHVYKFHHLFSVSKLFFFTLGGHDAVHDCLRLSFVIVVLENDDFDVSNPNKEKKINSFWQWLWILFSDRIRNGHVKLFQSGKSHRVELETIIMNEEKKYGILLWNLNRFMLCI